MNHTKMKEELGGEGVVGGVWKTTLHQETTNFRNRQSYVQMLGA
jgi:hypothetical protein